MERAQSLILAGLVLVEGQVADKPGHQYPESAAIEVREDPNPYASRGGLKLSHALKVFNVSCHDKTAVDVGASTGGFTDCLLQQGANKVFAVDVGYGQLDWKLRKDSRVTVVDRKNARNLALDDLQSEPLDIAAIDVSFISLKRIIPPVLGLLKPGADLIALVKPQFEVGKDEVENKGIIKDPEKHLKVLLDLRAFVEKQGWVVCGAAPSPIKGQKGNREFLIHCVEKSRMPALEEEIFQNMVME